MSELPQDTKHHSSFGAAGLEIKQSLIPGAGKGLFATRNFRVGEIIGTYYGTEISTRDEVPEEKEDYLFTTTDGRLLIPDEECVVAYANDAIDLIATVEEVLSWVGNRKKYGMHTLLKAIKVVLSQPPPTHKHPMTQKPMVYSLDWEEKRGVVMVKTIVPVAKGDEMFINYGECYWRHPVYWCIVERT
jgi:hypothetical protein